MRIGVAFAGLCGMMAVAAAAVFSARP